MRGTGGSSLVRHEIAGFSQRSSLAPDRGNRASYALGREGGASGEAPPIIPPFYSQSSHPPTAPFSRQASFVFLPCTPPNVSTNVVSALGIPSRMNLTIGAVTVVSLLSRLTDIPIVHRKTGGGQQPLEARPIRGGGMARISVPIPEKKVFLSQQCASSRKKERAAPLRSGGRRGGDRGGDRRVRSGRDLHAAGGRRTQRVGPGSPFLVSRQIPRWWVCGVIWPLFAQFCLDAKNV